MTQSPALPRPSAPLLLAGAELRALLRPRPLVAAIERALRELDGDELALAPTVHLPGHDGGFHLKAAFSRRAPRRAAVKLNGNFPGNPERHGLPTIQGILALLDLEHGNVLALMDSPVVTALRTAAVSALAARLLARPEASRIALVGCGVQAREHLELLALDFPLREARLFDRDRAAAERLARRAVELGLTVEISGSAADAVRDADLVVTTTSSAIPLLDEANVAPGAFVAAVGADNPTKCELAPELLARSRVVVDSLASAAANGDLRSALAAGAMSEGDVHGELPALVAGRIAGRTGAEQRFVFDSTGLAATDLAAAELAFDAASNDPGLPRFDFAGALPGRFEKELAMIWVTRARPVIDRIACPWLIVRFHDRDAQFLFLPPEDVLRTAAAIDGIAFDIPGGRYEHEGELCTFDVLVRELGLAGDPALLCLASIVRAADTDRLADVPQAAGLLAISFGLRDLHERAAEHLDAGFTIYDALYAWCRGDTEEKHNWKAARLA